MAKTRKIYHFSLKKTINVCSELLINLFIKKLIGTRTRKENIVLTMVEINFEFII